MSHYITCDRSDVRLFLKTQLNDVLMGIKRFHVYYSSENEKMLIKPFYYTSKDYNIRLENDFLVISNDIKKQDIIMDLGVYSGNYSEYKYTICKRKDAGIHIDYAIRRIAPYSYMLNRFIGEPQTYFVCFNVKDVVFYDGSEVSVKEIFIPHGQFIRENAHIIRDYLGDNQFDDMVKKHDKLIEEYRRDCVR